jgi:hypothetical protein
MAERIKMNDSKNNHNGAGNSAYNGHDVTAKAQLNSGWDIKKVSHWDFTEGRLPA